MSSIMRCRSGLMALSVMRDAPVLMEVANPSSQDRTPRRAIVLAVSSAAAPYRASGLVLWRKAAAGSGSPGGSFPDLLPGTIGEAHQFL
jgi:hypothetical protein